MIYGYARVSSSGQARDGNSLESQEIALKEHGAVRVFHDTYTGMKRHRPQFDELLSIIQDGDTLMVTKLDRLARSAAQGCEIVRELTEKGVTVNVLNMGVMDNTPTGKIIRTMLFAFAEFERDMIVERTSEGKRFKRETDPDYREGRKKQDVPGFPALYQAVKDDNITVSEAISQLGITKSKWYRLVKEAA